MVNCSDYCTVGVFIFGNNIPACGGKEIEEEGSVNVIFDKKVREG